MRLESVIFIGFEFSFKLLIFLLKLLDLWEFGRSKLIFEGFVLVLEGLILGFEFAIFLKDFGKSDLKGLKSCIAFEFDLSANAFQHDKLD
jgi:hypothetical protein